MHPDSTSQRVLVVDDDNSSRIIVDTYLSSAGHQVKLAENVDMALSILRADGCEQYAAVVTDYWMPGGTGVDLMKQAGALDPTLAFVLITAEGEKNIVAEALRIGGSDYLDKPVTGARLRESVARAISRTQSQRSLKATAQAALSLGRQQARLISQQAAAVRDRVELFFHSHTEASGDFAAAFNAGSEDRLMILASDTSGHDLSSAFHANYFHGLVRGMISCGASIHDVFHGFNGQLLEEWNPKDSVLHSLAALGLLIDLRNRTMELMNCGFPYPLAACHNGWGEYQYGTVPSSPLGWFAELPTSSMHTLPDGSLTLWSDGLGELADNLGVDPLALAHRLLRHIQDAAVLKSSRDDILVMRIRLGDKGQADWLPLAAQDYRGSQYAEIDTLVEFLDRSLRLALPEMKDECLADITVCAREALINALRHGCQNDPQRIARFRMAIASDGLSLQLRVLDDGPGYDFDAVQHEQIAAEQLLTEHRGLVMMRNIPTQIKFERRGADVTMTFPTHQHQSP